MKQSPCESTGKTEFRIEDTLFSLFFSTKFKYTHQHLDHYDKNKIKVLTDLHTSCENIQLIKSGLNWMSILHMCTNVTRHCKLVLWERTNLEPIIRQSSSKSDWINPTTRDLSCVWKTKHGVGICCNTKRNRSTRRRCCRTSVS